MNVQPHRLREEPEVFESEDEPQIEISEILRRLWGYKFLLAAVLLLTVGAAWVYLQNTPARYTATSVLLIEPPESNVIDLGNVVEGLDRSPQTLRTEVEVLQSRELAVKAIERLDLVEPGRLVQPPKAKSPLRHLNPLNYLPEDWDQGIHDYWESAKTALFGESPSPIVGETDKETSQKRYKIDGFLAGLQVGTELGTRIIKIEYTSGNPRYAAAAANALSIAYVANTLEVKFAGTRDATQWLGKQLTELRKKVEVSEAEAEGLRQGEALVQGRGATLVSEQISAINAQLLEVQATASRLSARMRQIEQLRRSVNWEDDTSALLGSQLLDGLRLEQFRLEREAAELATEYGEKHPKMINIRAEILDIAERFRREIDRIVLASKNELEVATTRRDTLKGRLNALTNQVGNLNEAEMRLRVVEREAEANRVLYESFLKRHNEASIQKEVQQADARVISYAEIPNSPSYPPRQKIWIGAVAVGLGLGLGLVILLQLLDKGFRTAEQFQRQTGLAVLAQIPLARGGMSMADQVTKKLYSRFSEAIGQLFVAAKLSSDGNSLVKTVLITSALPQEGKTSTAAALARRAALFGEKTLLVDCDFRRPQAGSQLHLKSHKGIAEILAGKALLNEVVQQDEVDKLHFLSCGSNVKDAAVLMRSKAFARLLETLKQHYDFVVFDSSPVLAVVEPLLLAQMVDKCFLLVRWGETPRKAVLTALRQLQDFGIKVDAAVFTQVDTKKQSYYGYGEYGYYSSKMKGYYSQ
jgi:capsular exopolysaccharide synthesis family protein